jgi:membrane associated rhomboid family serine protease
MNYQRQGFLSSIPPVVKTILIINVVLFVLSYVIPALNIYFPIYGFESALFRPYQFITHMFMHSGFTHIFFNMFALYMFGRVLEQYWGSKRFFIYYFVTGFGAALLHLLVLQIQANNLIAQMPPEQVDIVLNEGAKIWLSGRNYADSMMGQLNSIVNVPTVGASGAIYGLLLAFGVLFPNVEMFIMFIPIPIKAKYLVIFFIISELYLGFVDRPGDNVAHFAHLGGMLFGLIFIYFWKKKQFKRWD